MFPIVLGAIDAGQIVGLCVLVLSVLGGIVNFIQEHRPNAAPAKPKPKPNPQPARTEIETLLQQLTGEKPKPAPKREEQPRRPPKPQKDRSRSKPNVTTQRPGSPPPYTSSRQPARTAESATLTSTTSTLGSGVRLQQLGNPIAADVAQDIAIPVQHDLGNRIAPALPPQERSVHPLVKVLRDPNGVRQAFLLNEILQRPKSLRR